MADTTAVVARGDEGPSINKLRRALYLWVYYSRASASSQCSKHDQAVVMSCLNVKFKNVLELAFGRICVIDHQ